MPCVPALADGPSGGFREVCRACLCLLGLTPILGSLLREFSGLRALSSRSRWMACKRCGLCVLLLAACGGGLVALVVTEFLTLFLMSEVQSGSTCGPSTLWRFEVAVPMVLGVASFPVGSGCELQESVAAVVGCACYERGSCFTRAVIEFVVGLRVCVGMSRGLREPTCGMTFTGAGLWSAKLVGVGASARAKQRLVSCVAPLVELQHLSVVVVGLVLASCELSCIAWLLVFWLRCIAWLPYVLVMFSQIGWLLS
ncbi:hypothetical protein Taro_017441 [Colocasia esculenta]|uniref:Uncharacterized protein n=1 Tax=Colocasia esculenta TaxID=4460 RepID=A0A843UN46_COLES|nr:hypothetical protein [Colocasia esculenta]